MLLLLKTLARHEGVGKIYTRFVLPHVKEFPDPNSVLVCDNAPIYGPFAEQMQAMVEALVKRYLSPTNFYFEAVLPESQSPQTLGCWALS